ncbi:Lysozyme, partial [Orchesella cincta]
VKPQDKMHFKLNNFCETQSVLVRRNRVYKSKTLEVACWLFSLLPLKTIMNLYFCIILVASTAVSAVKYTGPTNQAGRNLIKEFEGFYANFYNDPVGIRTIGYGHACHVWSCSNPLNGKYRVPLTRSTAEQLLIEDLGAPGRYEGCVNNAVTYNNLNANQFSALTSFVFNMGCGNFRSSTLRRKLNRGDISGAANEFRKWVNAGGRRLSGLVRRRAAERALFSAASLLVTGCTARYTGSTNKAAVNLIKEFANFTADFNLDKTASKPTWTIGYGHTCPCRGSHNPNCIGNACTVPLKGTITLPLTNSSADELLQDDLKEHEVCVRDNVLYKSLTSNQFSALVSFVHSFGCGQFQKSDLRAKINKGNISGAAKEFMKWAYSGTPPQLFEHLKDWRIAERKLFCLGSQC